MKNTMESVNMKYLKSNIGCLNFTQRVSSMRHLVKIWLQWARAQKNSTIEFLTGKFDNFWKSKIFPKMNPWQPKCNMLLLGRPSWTRISLWQWYFLSWAKKIVVSLSPTNLTWEEIWWLATCTFQKIHLLPAHQKCPHGIRVKHHRLHPHIGAPLVALPSPWTAPPHHDAPSVACPSRAGSLLRSAHSPAPRMSIRCCAALRFIVQGEFTTEVLESNFDDDGWC
jgi:hypothetical protein